MAPYSVQTRKRNKPIKMKKRKPAPLTIVPKTLKELRREGVAKVRIIKQKKASSRRIQKLKRLLETKEGKGKQKNSSQVINPEELVNVEQIAAAIKGVRTLSNKVLQETTQLMEIGSDPLICLQVTVCKLPTEKKEDIPKTLSIKIPLPHSVVNEETDVLLITRMLNSEHGSDHEKTLNHFKEILRTSGASRHITEVITLRQLRMEYKEYEAKRNLANRFDVVLGQDCVMKLLPKLLGKHFFEKKKVPRQVDLTVSNLDEHIQDVLTCSVLEMNMRGNSSSIQVGRISQTDEQVLQNVLIAIEKIAERIPGGWNNIQSLSLKTNQSKSVPFYVKLDKGPVTIKKAKEPPQEVIEGELDTLPNHLRVRIGPDGDVTVFHKNDPKKAPVKKRKVKKNK